MKNWYLLCYKYGQIKRVQASLGRLGVNSYSPTIQIEKRRSDSGTMRQINEPMFPTYLFVEFDVEEVHTTKISAAPGISYFVKFGSEPKPVPKNLINALMARSEKNDELSNKINEISANTDKEIRCAMFISLIKTLPTECELNPYSRKITIRSNFSSIAH
ncbi:transcription termination/antitermination NusG family protein [Xenorhabdus bovienii]|uniref:transcription termination/antitermination NusG family protein n=1 Tax=Xenorhabdus bovienii TaxID=40576 RepID=UPI003DA45742